jgi:hypothetical protein
MLSMNTSLMPACDLLVGRRCGEIDRDRDDAIGMLLIVFSMSAICLST